jgi:AcrR family transcriptional regulator
MLGNRDGKEQPPPEAPVTPVTADDGKQRTLAGPPHRTSRAARATRQTILEAARREFADQGFEAATTVSIARRAGITQPLIHYHFGSKEDLWRASVSDLFQSLHEAVDRRTEELDGTGPGVRLVSICQTMFEFALTHPELPRLLNTEGSLETPRLTWLVDTYLRPLVTRWSERLDAAKEAGIINDGPNAFLFSALAGACQHFFNLAPMVREVFGIDPHSSDTARAYANAIIEVFLEGAATRPPEGP